MRRFPLAALLVLLAATPLAAQDEPELVRRFETEERASFSQPWSYLRSPSTLVVVEGYEFVQALWRIHDGGAPEVLATIPDPDRSPNGWFGPGRAIGDSVLVSGPGGLWRIDPQGAPQRIEVGSGLPIGDVRGTALLAKSDATRGTELWRTDGTVGGATLVADIEPGSGSSTPGAGVTVGSTLFFFATTAEHGRELWRSDGTAEGTALAADLVPGASSSSGWIVGRLPGAVMVLGTAEDGVETLWRCDGTPSGTTPVFRDERTFAQAVQGMDFGDRFVFLAGEDSFTYSLWATDGTEEGTEKLLHGKAWHLLAVAGGQAYFSVRETPQTRVTDLWCTDGTVAGTRPVKVFSDSGAASGGVSIAEAFGSDLVFAAASLDEGSSLWRTDGTEEGTAPILTEADGVRVVRPSGMPNDYYPGLFAVVDDQIYFSGTGDPFAAALYVSDGTVGDFRAVPLSSTRVEAIHEIEESAGTLFFAATDPTSGRELWASDGTVSGTDVVTELAPGDETSGVAELTDMGDELWFSGGAAPGTYSTLYRATVDTYSAIADVSRGETLGGAGRLHRIGDLLYFRAYFDYDDLPAWVSDGTEAGTLELGGDSPYRFFDVDGSALFFSRRGGNWNDLWESDGTVGGTGRIKELTPPIGQTHLGDAEVVGDVLFFAAAGSADGLELWRSDGTTSGTVVDANLVEGEGSGAPEHLFGVGDRLFFSAQDADGFTLLRRRSADGSIAMLWDGGDYRYARAEVVGAIEDSVLFLANSEEHGRELWSTDDTARGAHLLRDIDVGDAYLPPRDFVDVGNGRFVFAAYDVRHGTELWTTDGTSAGTLLAADLVTGPRGSHPTELTVLGDNLYLTVDGIGRASDLVRVPLSLLDDVSEPPPLPALDALPPLPPVGPEPAPIEEPPVDPPPADPEPLTLDALKIRLDTKRTGRDRLRVKFRLPLDCGADKFDLPLRVDVGGVLVDVRLDTRGRARPAAGVRVKVRNVRPRRKKDVPTEVRVDIDIRRADLRTPLADENLVLPDGEKRIERTVRVVTTWCDTDHATNATVRYKQRRGVGTAKLVDTD